MARVVTVYPWVSGEGEVLFIAHTKGVKERASGPSAEEAIEKLRQIVETINNSPGVVTREVDW